MIKFRIILIVLLLLSASAFCDSSDTEEENVFRCAACGKVITKTAAVVDGKLYHPECFRCAACNKQIEGEYLRDTDGKYYHPACLERLHRPVCAYCGKSITEKKYITYQGSAYHTECYTKYVAPRCDICGEPLENSYITDYWGNRFHPRHTKEYPVCAVCGRLIWQDDGFKLDDKRWLCPVCASESVTSPEHARRLLEEIRAEMASLGIVVKTLRVRIELVENSALVKKQEPYTHSHTFAYIEWKDGNTKPGDESAVIRALYGAPEDFMRGILAHELMHAWQHENDVSSASIELLEGSANWASSLIYKRMYTKRGQFFLNGLDKSTDPVYGEGYRKIAIFADKNNIHEVLEMLKQEGEK
ncbi:MAG: protein DA1 [Candidatus Hatepunaea meridiana]|nr:protein DA1 [Candidatus Hatepunaea meridiana]